MANQTSAVQDQVNLVGAGTVFEGTIRADNDVRASGRIIGTLNVEGKAMIAEDGSVEGKIIATDADIAGQVQGEIHVDNRLVLKSTARVDGEIETDRLVVEEGAQFTGECEMGTPIPDTGSSTEDEPGVSSEHGETDEEVTPESAEVSAVPESE